MVGSIFDVRRSTVLSLYKTDCSAGLVTRNSSSDQAPQSRMSRYVFPRVVVDKRQK